MFTKNYLIANLNLTLTCPQPMELKPTVPFSAFASPLCLGASVAVLVRFALEGEETFPKQPPLWEEGFSRLYQEEDGFAEYWGSDLSGPGQIWQRKVRFALDGSRVEIILPVSEGRSLKSLSEQGLFRLLHLEYLMAHHNRTILHSSFLIYQGRAILFTAPSGTGKSTQADLWKTAYPQQVEILNGDRSILSCDGEESMAHGLPFCGTSGIAKNQSAPLAAVVILRQGKENRLTRPQPFQLITALLEQCAIDVWDKFGTQQVLDLLVKIIQNTPVYYYECLPDRTAVETLKTELEQQGAIIS